MRDLPVSPCLQSPASEAAAVRIVQDFAAAHGQAVVRVICKQLRGVLDSDGCLDVYQTVLIAFWRVVARKLAAGAYDPDNPMRLALGIASRAIRAARRKAGRHPFLALVARLDGERAPDGEADECFHRDLLAAFRTLTPVQRRVIDAHLAYLDATGKVRGGRYRRIALDLGLTEAAVRAVFRKAVRKLNTYLKPRGWIL